MSLVCAWDNINSVDRREDRTGVGMLSPNIPSMEMMEFMQYIDAKEVEDIFHC
jgi:hypothetical protein